MEWGVKYHFHVSFEQEVEKNNQEELLKAIPDEIVVYDRDKRIFQNRTLCNHFMKKIEEEFKEEFANFNNQEDGKKHYWKSELIQIEVCNDCGENHNFVFSCSEIQFGAKTVQLYVTRNMDDFVSLEKEKNERRV
jgi:hypothetical protein